MAVKSLIWRPGGKSDNSSEGKNGGMSFSGHAKDYYEWMFRTRLIQRRALSCDKDSDRFKLIDSIISNLSGDALGVAMDIGVDDLGEPDGLDRLVTDMTSLVFPEKQQEAKELYSAGHETQGVLTRQRGESMYSICKRRSRWYTLLRQMGPGVIMSAKLRGDMLLDRVGLSRDQKLMIKTSINNDTDYTTIAQALQKQHPIIHTHNQEKTWH